MVTESHARAAAWTAAAILTVIAGFYVYWGLGGTWALPATPGKNSVSTSDHFAVVFFGLVGLWFAAVLLIRVGYWPKLARFAVARLNAWVIAVLVLGGAIQTFAAQEFVAGTVNLIVALLAFVVARSELPDSLRNRGGTRSRWWETSSKPGPPTPTHFSDRPLHPYRLPPRRR
jgi:hypothetical protein